MGISLLAAVAMHGATTLRRRRGFVLDGRSEAAFHSDVRENLQDVDPRKAGIEERALVLLPNHIPMPSANSKAPKSFQFLVRQAVRDGNAEKARAKQARIRLG